MSHHTTWAPTQEPHCARQARALAASAAEATDAQVTVNTSAANAAFWRRQDLLYIGDLEWARAGYEGYEYLADLTATNGSEFRYTYAFVALASPDQVAQTMICDVRNHPSDPFAFEMLVAGEWQPGPLQAWLDSLEPDVLIIANERYRALIAWVRNTLQLR